MVVDRNRKDAPLMMMAISRIMQQWLMPGIVGIMLIAVGFWLHIECVEMAGLVLAAPEIWVSIIILFVLLPIAGFKRVQENRKSKNALIRR